MAPAARRRRRPTPSSPDLELPDAEELARFKLSPEVAWYLLDRGIGLPDCPPLWKTPEAGEVLAEAVFDPARVDRVLQAFGSLQHTKGKWAGRPLRPDPWQVAYVVAPAFGWVRPNDDGSGWVRVVTELYVEVPRKNGKGVYAGDMILTRDGWKRFGDLQAGDEVHAEDGSLTRVSWTSPIRELDCYRVTFGDGQTVVCDADHRWTVWDRYGHDPKTWADAQTKGAWRVVEAPELYATHRSGSRGDTRYSVRTDRILDRPALDLPLDPYLLGAWLGDGATDAARITSADPAIPAAFADHGFTVRRIPGTITYAINDGLRPLLRSLGVLGHKHVPEAYLIGSADQRMTLLQGLMDTDGSVIRGHNTPRVEFTTTNPDLADAALFLARSLGWRATSKEGRATLEGVDHGPKWRVSWTAFSDRAPFRLARKRDRLHSPGQRRTRSSTNTIVSVERVPTVPTMCISVEHPSEQFLVGRGLVPTHNSTTCGGIGIYLTCGDGEDGAEVIVAATSKDQAGFVFSPIQQLASSSPALRPHVKALTSKIVHRRTGSYMKPVANVADAQHGGNIHGAVIDELHLHRSPDVVEAIETGTGSREQPLIVFIGTADDGQTTTIYARKRDRVEKLADRVLTNPAVFGVVFAAEEGDDPHDETTWRKANPGFGISPTRRSLQQASDAARDDPAAMAGFLRFRLGIRTGLAERFIPLDAWDRNAGMVDRARLRGRLCYGGLDLATTSDLTAFALVFPDKDGDGYDVLWRHWIPERAFGPLNQRTSGQAAVWRREGLLSVTEGDVTDYAFVRRDINTDREAFDVVGIGYDRWNSSQVCVELENDDGAPMEQIGQGFAALSAPLKALKHELLAGTPFRPRFRHGGNPLVRWQATNLRTEEDAAGNVKPSKKRSMDKIDGLSAAVDAMALVLANAEPEAVPDVW